MLTLNFIYIENAVFCTQYSVSFIAWVTDFFKLPLFVI